MAENLTDYWHLPWFLLSTDKGPDCPLFSSKPVFKALNSIVPFFSSDNVIKCAFLGVILAARRRSYFVNDFTAVKPMCVMYHLL